MEIANPSPLAADTHGIVQTNRDGRLPGGGRLYRRGGALRRFSMTRPHLYPCRCRRCNTIRSPSALRCVAVRQQCMSSGRFRLPVIVLSGYGIGCGDPGRSVVVGNGAGGYAYRCRSFVGAGSAEAWCGTAAPCQPPRQPAEGAGARWSRPLAGT